MFRNLVLICLLFAGCSTPEAPTRLKTLRISFASYPTSLDPRMSGDFVSATMVGLLYDGLTRCLPDGSPEPALADSVEISDDLKSYVFSLREAYWSDGRRVVARDFEQSWKQQLDPKSPSLCTYLFYPILNAEKAAKGEKGLNEVGIYAIDDQTLKVELEYPTAYFLSLTSFPSFLPVASHTEAPVVNGPFTLEKEGSQSELVLKKNSFFWNHENIQIEEIKISIIPDEHAALGMFERGELDWLGELFRQSPLMRWKF